MVGEMDGDVDGTNVGLAVVGASVGACVLSQQDIYEPSAAGQQFPRENPILTQRECMLQCADVVGLGLGLVVGLREGTGVGDTVGTLLGVIVGEEDGRGVGT